MSAAEEREKTAAAVELLGALPMPVGPGPLRDGCGEGACALCDVVKPNEHAVRDHVLNVHPDEFCLIYHAQPCQHDQSADRLTAFFAPVASLREDPHDGPLHRDYRVGRDLPESGGGR